MSAATAAAEPWGFEQVTPVDKGSGVVSSTVAGFIASPDGKSLLHSGYLPYESLPVNSAPAQSRYLAERGEKGWVNQALDPPYLLPQTPMAAAQFIQAVLGVSQNLDYALIASRVPLTPEADPAGGSVYLKNTRTGALRLIFTTTDQNVVAVLLGNGGANGYTYVANDGESVLFTVNGDPLVPGAPGVGGGGGHYSWSEDAGLRYEVVVGGVMVNNLEIPGGSNIGPRDSMPFDGRGLDHVYFQADSGSQGPLYVREGPASSRSTRLITYSRLVAQPAPATGGVPLAVGAGGRYALFRTTNNVAIAGGELAVPSTGRHLYRFDAEATDPADELAYVGAVPNAARIIQMSQDGKTIAFYSTIAQAGSPAGAQHKLFVWREGHGLKYVYTADAGSTGTSLQNQLRRMSDNARFLTFTDNSASLAAQFGGFNNTSPGCPNAFGMPGVCDMVYRYDIENEVLDCVSCRDDGAAPLGASGEPGRTAAGLLELNRYQPRMAADDGTVFFTSRDALVADDRNGLDDAYAWTKDSGSRLLSRATPGKRSRFVDASADGSVVFLASRDRLANTDQDDEDDIYATFAGAGIGDDTRPPVVAPCSGADCRGVFPGSPTPPTPGTERPAGANNVERAAARPSLRVLWTRVRKGKLEVRVRASAGGDLRVSGTTLRAVKRSVADRGVYTLSARLTKKSSQRLRQRGRLAVTVRATLSPPFGPSTKTSYRRTVRK